MPPKACARSWSAARGGLRGGERAGGMRIHYMSDVHLEFGALDKPLPEGDVVVLAGDITLLAALDPAKADPTRAARSRGDAAVLRGGHRELRHASST